MGQHNEKMLWGDGTGSIGIVNGDPATGTTVQLATISDALNFHEGIMLSVPPLFAKSFSLSILKNNNFSTSSMPCDAGNHLRIIKKGLPYTDILTITQPV